MNTPGDRVKAALRLCDHRQSLCPVHAKEYEAHREIVRLARVVLTAYVQTCDAEGWYEGEDCRRLDDALAAVEQASK